MAKTTIKGKRFVKEEVIEFEGFWEGIRIMSSKKTGFFARIDEYEKYAINKLNEMGYDLSRGIDPIRGNYLKKEDHLKKMNRAAEFPYEVGEITIEERDKRLAYISTEFKRLSKSGLLYEPYSMTSFLVDMLQAIYSFKNDKNSFEERLQYAFEAGDLFRRIKIYQDYGANQSVNAKEPRKQKVNDYILKLASDLNAKPAELWNKFVGAFDGRENTNEKGNLMCTYRSPESDDLTEIAFSTFSNKISKARNNKK
jgi:hypothetical protein